jgi:hypothetical protein
MKTIPRPDSNQSNGDGPSGLTLLGALVIFCLLVVGAFTGCQHYRIYAARSSGEAALAEAESTRRVSVLEAQAKLDSASKLAEAEVVRARGVAQANQIIGESLKGNDAYLRYLWIQTLESGKNDTIYVPTEANLPILEAQRLAPAPELPKAEP